jgi:hypothetical protein
MERARAFLEDVILRINCDIRDVLFRKGSKEHLSVFSQDPEKIREISSHIGFGHVRKHREQIDNVPASGWQIELESPTQHNTSPIVALIKDPHVSKLEAGVPLLNTSLAPLNGSFVDVDPQVTQISKDPQDANRKAALPTANV